LLTAPRLEAQSHVSVTLGWDSDPSSGAVAYNVYYGTSSRVYTQMVPVGNTNQATITGLDMGTTYFIAVTALDATGLESSYSDEIAFTPTPSAPSLQPGPAAPGQFTVQAHGAAGHLYDILASQDLRNWIAIGTVTAAPDGSVTFVDVSAGQYPSRFYRLHDTTYALAGNLPRMSMTPTPSGLADLQLTGQVGHRYDILASQNLEVWTVIGTVTAGASGVCAFRDPMASHYPSRFYRLHETTYTPDGTPQLRILAGKAGTTSLQVAGQVGHVYDILASQDLTVWTAIGTVTAGVNGLSLYHDPKAGRYPARYYRLHEVTYTPEGSLPTFHAVPLPWGQVLLAITGQVGHSYDVLATPDYQEWTLLGTVLAGRNGSAEFIDHPDAPRFYRLRESAAHR
jgi:hypothetical protein